MPGFDAPAKDQSKYHHIDLNAKLVQRPHSTIMLEVADESMWQVGLYSGDTIIVDRAQAAKNGDLVVAEISGTFTLGYYSKDKHDRPCIVK